MEGSENKEHAANTTGRRRTWFGGENSKDLAHSVSFSMAASTGNIRKSMGDKPGPRRSLSSAWNKLRRSSLQHQDMTAVYGGLLSAAPSSITFVIRRRETKTHNSKNIHHLLGVQLVKTEGNRFQIEDCQDKEVENDSTENYSQALLPPELTALLRPGDFLESVDGIPVGGKRRMLSKNRCFDEEELYNTITGNNNDEEENTIKGVGGSVVNKTKEAENSSTNSYLTKTLTFVCGGTTASQSESTTSSNDTTNENSSESLTSSVISTSLDSPSGEESEAQTPKPATTTLPTVHKAYFLDQTEGNDENDIENGILDDFLALETIQKSTNNHTDLHKAGNSPLHIGSIPQNHWLGKQSKIRAGDVLLCADDIPCHNGELSPGDVSLVWRTALMTKVLVSNSETKQGYTCITTARVPTRMDSIRKTAVAATGGALMGTGAVLMVTPLHPVGHAMAIGGLGVLGTEFEAPKKAFEKAKQSAANLASRVKKLPEEGKTSDEKSSALNDGAEDQFISN